MRNSRTYVYDLEKKSYFGGFLSLLIDDFAVRDSEKTLPIHYTNAIHIPPFGCSSTEKSYISVALCMEFFLYFESALLFSNFFSPFSWTAQGVNAQWQNSVHFLSLS